MLDEWLKSVKNGRRGDILCVYLLSMATETHTAVHLSNNKVWSTLEVMPTSHDDLMRQCNKHLVYLGLGVFLQFKERATVNVLGTVTGQDPETHKLLVASVTQSIKQEKHKDGNTNVYPKKRDCCSRQCSTIGSSRKRIDDHCCTYWHYKYLCYFKKG